MCLHEYFKDRKSKNKLEAFLLTHHHQHQHRLQEASVGCVLLFSQPGNFVDFQQHAQVWREKMSSGKRDPEAKACKESFSSVTE